MGPGDDTNKTIKEVTRASPQHSSRGPTAKWLATYPPIPRVSWGLIVYVVTFAGLGLSVDKALPIPYYHVMNNKTQGRILHQPYWVSLSHFVSLS